MMAQLETLLELQTGTLKGSDQLSTFAGWDSLTQTNFIFLAERAIGIRLPVERFVGCHTADEVIDVIEVSRPA